MQYSSECPDRLIFFLSFKIYFISLKWKVRKRERERQRQDLCIHWFTPNVVTVAMIGPGWSQKPWSTSEALTWVAECKCLGHLMLPPRQISRDLGLKQKSYYSNLCSSLGSALQVVALPTVAQCQPEKFYHYFWIFINLLEKYKEEKHRERLAVITRFGPVWS